MADSCIICMEELDVVPDAVANDLHDAGAVTGVPSKPTPTHQHPDQIDDQQSIALIKPCGHVLHDECLRQWAQKANSCPICRHIFNQVEVLDKVGGTILSEYEVENKKQVAEFDPAAWIDDNDEDEDDQAMDCLVCDTHDSPEVLLICEGCQSAYHTQCLGLDSMPSGNSWFCMVCEDDGTAVVWQAARPRRPYSSHPRTRASIQQTRHRMRADNWAGVWGQFSNQVHNAVGLDLDFSDDDQQHMSGYRLHQTQTARERAEFEQWQRRFDIAARQGAGRVFRNSAPLLREPRPATSASIETPEETKAWGALERAKEIESTPSSAPRSRKRKSRSTTNSPTSPTAPAAEPSQEPERKLKRPRTRRVLDPPLVTSSVITNSRAFQFNRLPGSPTRPYIDTSGEPSFLSSLLKEVETATSDDETARHTIGAMIPHPAQMTSPSTEYSSPGASPSPPSSRHHSPRPMSTTPPPRNENRPGSPLPLTSSVTPRLPNSDYSSNRSPPEIKDTPVQDHPSLELRQPRPRRPTQHSARSPAISPARANMTTEAKEGINKIVKSALGPHWKAAEITKEQYADINRDVSRKLYEIVTEDNETDNQDRFTWEKIASAEVAAAVKSLKT